MTLEWLNNRCVGHLTTAQTLERITAAEFPLKLKFTELADGDRGSSAPASPRGAPASPRADYRSSNKRAVELSKNVAEPARLNERFEANYTEKPIKEESVLHKRGQQLPKSPRKIIKVQDAGSVAKPISMSPRGEVREDNKAQLLQNQRQGGGHYEQDSEGTDVE